MKANVFSGMGIDPQSLGVCVLESVEERVDFQTGEPKRNKDGLIQYAFHIRRFPIGRENQAEDLEVRSYLEKKPEFRPYTQVFIMNPTIEFWENNGKSGFYFTAEKVVSAKQQNTQNN